MRMLRWSLRFPFSASRRLPGGTITVKDFNQANNTLGIRLVDLPLEPPTDLMSWPAFAPQLFSGLRNDTPYDDYDANPAVIDLDGNAWEGDIYHRVRWTLKQAA